MVRRHATRPRFSNRRSTAGGSGSVQRLRSQTDVIPIYFKVYKSQIPVIEQAIETAADSEVLRAIYAPLCGNQSPGCNPTRFRRPSGHIGSGSGPRSHGHRARETDRSRISTLVGSRRGPSVRNGTKWHRADLEFRLGFRLISRHCTPTVSTGRRKVEHQKLRLASLPEGVECLSPATGHPTSTFGREASPPIDRLSQITVLRPRRRTLRLVKQHVILRRCERNFQDVTDEQGQRFQSATWLHKARQIPKAEFRRRERTDGQRQRAFGADLFQGL